MRPPGSPTGLNRQMSYTSSSMGDVDSDPGFRVVNYEDTIRQLDLYYGVVKRQLLRYQSPTTGLFASLSDDNKIAHARDSIYCAAAIWSLYQAHRRIDDDRGRAHELGQSAVKCMRGILFCWFRQADKIESFKNNQSTNHALHTVFDLHTGDPLYKDNEYAHLQIDVPSLYILFLVQMITSGLQIIYTMDEVTFVQNLVYYVERAYRTPDFGMWERGSKYNNNTPELHASSIGMAKAALEAINGCNLFGDKGASWSVIYVDIDAHNRNRSIFETLLPRESSSKNTDVSLLPCISFPCFATHDETLYNATKTKIVRKLKGDYGFKRFLRDGYGTELEDKNRKYYRQGEIKNFDNIECEWPLFFIYMIIDGIFKGNTEQADAYQKLLHQRISRDRYGDILIPKYYYVLREGVEAERLEPGSQMRLPSKEGEPGCLFLWGQALYIISQLLVDNLLNINELDPIRRYLPSYSRPRRTARYSAFQGTASDLVVQVVLIAESMRLQAMMATYGIHTQTPHEVEPVQIWPPRELVKVYEYLGVNKKLGLTGRPPRPIGALGTSKVYRICGQTVLCYPLAFDIGDFYLSHDMALLIDDIKSDLQFVGKYWRLYGRPTVCLLIREEHMRDANFKEMLDLLAMLKSGRCHGLKVRVGRLQNLLSSSCIEHLDFIHHLSSADLNVTPFKQLEHRSAGYQSLTDIRKAVNLSETKLDYEQFLNKSTKEIIDTFELIDSLYGKSRLLGILYHKEGANFSFSGESVKEKIGRLNSQACGIRHWSVVRYCSSFLEKIIDSISPYITSLLVNGKQMTVGVCGHEEVLIDMPLTPKEIHHIIYTRIQPYDIYQAVLQQEIISYLGKLIATHHSLFTGILKIRIGWVIRALNLYKDNFSTDSESLDALSPSGIRKLLTKVLSVTDCNFPPNMNPLQRRQIDGCLSRVPKDFYERVWQILAKTPGGIIVAGHHLPQQPTMSDMTMQELNFSLLIETILNKLEQPEYRQIIVEMIMVVSTILQRNPELMFEREVDLDKLVGDAFKLFLKDRADGVEKSDDMADFYLTVPNVTVRYLARSAVNYILGAVPKNETQEFCKIS